MYRNETYINSYLYPEFNHHPAELSFVIKSLTQQTERLVNNDHIQKEQKKLITAFKQNGFSISTVTTKSLARAHLPYIMGTIDRIDKILRRQNIQVVFNTNKKSSAISQEIQKAQFYWKVKEYTISFVRITNEELYEIEQPTFKDKDDETLKLSRGKKLVQDIE